MVAVGACARAGTRAPPDPDPPPSSFPQDDLQYSPSAALLDSSASVYDTSSVPLSECTAPRVSPALTDSALWKRTPNRTRRMVWRIASSPSLNWRPALPNPRAGYPSSGLGRCIPPNRSPQIARNGTYPHGKTETARQSETECARCTQAAGAARVSCSCQASRR